MMFFNKECVHFSLQAVKEIYPDIHETMASFFALLWQVPPIIAQYYSSSASCFRCLRGEAVGLFKFDFHAMMTTCQSKTEGITFTEQLTSAVFIKTLHSYSAVRNDVIFNQLEYTDLFNCMMNYPITKYQF